MTPWAFTVTWKTSCSLMFGVEPGPMRLEGVGDGLIVDVVFGEVDVDVVDCRSGLVPDPAGDETHGPGALVVDHLQVVDDSVRIERRVPDALLQKVEGDVLTGAGLKRDDRRVEGFPGGDGGSAEGGEAAAGAGAAVSAQPESRATAMAARPRGGGHGDCRCAVWWFERKMKRKWS
jgi:hypothetical protein